MGKEAAPGREPTGPHRFPDTPRTSGFDVVALTLMNCVASGVPRFPRMGYGRKIQRWLRLSALETHWKT